MTDYRRQLISHIERTHTGEHEGWPVREPRTRLADYARELPALAAMCAFVAVLVLAFLILG